MKLNKMVIHVKRNIDGFLNTLFGMITKFEQPQSRLHEEAMLPEHACLDNQAEKALLEAEVKKNQGIELVRRLQNC